jgi:hypothetical protein
MDKGKFIMLKYLRRIIVIVAILMVLLSHAPMAQAAPLAQSINSSGGNPKEAAGHPLPGIGSDPCAPIVVSNTNNSGPGSLRQAMVDICAGGRDHIRCGAFRDDDCSWLRRCHPPGNDH